MGLCEVYNKGAEKALYDVLCFAHEDILMRTPKWGQKVVDTFHHHPDLGLLGVAGSSYKPVVPSGWSFPYALPSTMYTNYIQTVTGASNVSYKSYNNPDNKDLSQVVSVDGMWFCTRKKIALEIRFDEVRFRRFHCYDVDYSIAVYQKYKVAVTFDVLVEHFSSGSFGEEWAEETLKLHKKWKKYLPVNLARLDPETQKSQEIGAYYFFLKIFALSALPVYALISSLWSQKLLSITGYKTFIKLDLKVLKDKAALLLKQKK